MKKPIPNDVRQQVLNQHARLRDALGTVHNLARSTNPADAEALREEALLFLSALSFHLDFEDRTLLPILEDIDAWGKERVEHVRKEHEEQRADIADLEKRVTNASEPREAVAAAVEAFRTRLLLDMTNEEKDTLDAHLFAEDVVDPDMIDG